MVAVGSRRSWSAGPTLLLRTVILEWDFTLNLSNWVGGKWLGSAHWVRDKQLEFKSLRYFADFIEGRLPAEFPDMRGFWDSVKNSNSWEARCTRELHDFATNEQHPMRNVKLRKEVERIFENAGSIETIDLD